jgi:hypothetical protein
MSIIFILIQINFDIDINNDELLKTIWKHKKRRRKINKLSSIAMCNNIEPKYNY